MTYVDDKKLLFGIRDTLTGLGISLEDAAAVAARFVNDERENHPDWFVKPKIRGDIFLEARIQEWGKTSRHKKAIEGTILEYRKLRLEYQRLEWGGWGSDVAVARTKFKILQDVLSRFAEIWLDHEDYQQIEWT